LEQIDLRSIDWGIVGGESGTNARPISESWVQNILKQCKDADIPFFFKQWGGFNKKKNGKLLNGIAYQEMPHFK
jgi:protein gp37